MATVSYLTIEDSLSLNVRSARDAVLFQRASILFLSSTFHSRSLSFGATFNLMHLFRWGTGDGLLFFSLLNIFWQAWDAQPIRKAYWPVTRMGRHIITCHVSFVVCKEWILSLRVLPRTYLPLVNLEHHLGLLVVLLMFLPVPEYWKVWLHFSSQATKFACAEHCLCF